MVPQAGPGTDPFESVSHDRGRLNWKNLNQWQRRSHETMRQGQHSKKGRGRNRRQSNPGNRVYESNGPDVKIRGNASHVSEKYLALARDAQAAGDPIGAENYLQHAEHYLRIIAAAQAQQAQQNQPCVPDRAGDEGRSDQDAAQAPARRRARPNGDGRRDEEATANGPARDPEHETATANGAQPEAGSDGPGRKRRGARAGKSEGEDAVVVQSSDEAPAESAEEQVQD